MVTGKDEVTETKNKNNNKKDDDKDGEGELWKLNNGLNCLDCQLCPSGKIVFK